MTWKTISGFEDYSISDIGEVVSWKSGEARILSQSTNPDGYKQVKLYRDGKATLFQVHRLVAGAFLGERPEGYQVAHNNGNPADNSVSNLRYATPAENQADRKLHGTDSAGSKNGCAKLTEDDVLQIRLSYSGVRGEQAALSKLFGISDTVINQIIWGRIWKSVIPTEYVCVRGPLEERSPRIFDSRG